MKRIVMAIIFGVACLNLFGPSPITQTAMAAKCAKEDAVLVTIKPWYSGLCKSGTNDVVVDSNLSEFTVKLALNLLSIALQIGGYVAVGFVIWGGIRYILAAGEAGSLAKSKVIIQNAVIGLLIVLASVAIVEFVKGAVLKP